MNSNQIKCFISLGKTHNFSQTARNLFLTQPTVSKNIKNLEKELGFKLIKSTHPQVKLTKDGEYFYKNVVKIDQNFSSLIKTIKNHQVSEKKTITIGFTNIPFEQEYLPIFLKEIQKYDHFNIVLKSGITDTIDIKKELDQGQVDLALLESDFFYEDKYNFFPFFKTGFSLMMNKNNPLKAYHHVPIAKLAKLETYLYEPRIPLRSIQVLEDAINLAFSDTNNKLKIINQMASAKIIAASSNAVIIVPSIIYDHSDKNFCYPFLEWKRSVSYGIASYKKSKNSAEHQHIIHVLNKIIQQLQKDW